MRQIGLDELKRLQLQILDEVVEFCNRHQIKYFLLGGTLLGAVRHQGYIPWDDDIDIGMLREDYDRFIKEFHSSYDKNKLYLYNYHVNKECIFPFTKVCMNNTLIEEEVYVLKNKYGINIDIFPIDSIRCLPRKVYINIRFWRRIREFKAVRPVSSKIHVLIMKRVLFFLCKLINYPTIFKNSERFFIKDQRERTYKMGNLIWGYGECELVSPSIFDEYINILFEGKYYRVPKKYHEWLSAVYGDYMVLPPEDKRVAHNVKAFVLDD